MFLGVWRSPSLGLGSTNGLLILLGLLMVVVSTMRCEGGNAPGDEGRLCLVSWMHFKSVSWLLLRYTSHPHRFWLFAGDRISEDGMAQSFTVSSRVKPS